MAVGIDQVVPMLPTAPIECLEGVMLNNLRERGSEINVLFLYFHNDGLAEACEMARPYRIARATGFLTAPVIMS